MSFTSSLLDPSILLAGPLNNTGSGNTLGKGRALILSWKQSTRMSNVDNAPIKVTQLELYCKQSVPAVLNFGQAKALATGAGTMSLPTAAAASFEGWVSQAMGDQVTQIAGNLQALASLNPNLSSGSSNSNATNIPGFELTDCKMFNAHFKIVGRTTRTIQPGQATDFIQLSKRAMTVNEELYYSFANSGSGTGYALKFLAWKGFRYFVYKFESIPVGATGGGTADVTLGKGYLNIVQIFRYSTTYILDDTLRSFVPTTLLPVGITEKLIFPGTSTATTQAPAI